MIILENRIVSNDQYPKHITHIFPFNKDVNDHNIKMLNDTKEEIYTICASQSKSDSETEQLNTYTYKRLLYQMN